MIIKKYDFEKKDPQTQVHDFVKMIVEVDQNTSEINLINGHTGYLFILLKLEKMIRDKFSKKADSSDVEEDEENRKESKEWPYETLKLLKGAIKKSLFFIFNETKNYNDLKIS